MGADRAIHIEITDPIDPLTCARSLLKIVEKEEPGLVLLGKQAIDDDNGQTGPMLAALWNRPQASFASELVLADGTARVTCEVDIGLQIVEVDLPAVVTVDLRLNEPRYVKLPDIMKAKKKPLETVALDDLDVGPMPGVETLHFEPPPARAKGVMVNDAAALIAALQEKGFLT
jgi:electron transfer flavoprotein beta subunit